MKRSIGSMMALSLCGLAGSVLAQGIVDSEHDFEGKYGLTEKCLPCHTPHQADPTAPGPLWNHELTTSTFTMYTTLQGRTGTPDGPSKLCLSCHDGVVAIDSYGGNTGTDFMSGHELIGTDLSNDHPIGLSYPPPDASEYETVSNVEAAGLKLPTVGADKRVECSSCHNPHDDFNGDFLRISNNFSALCMTCHKK